MFKINNRVKYIDNCRIVTYGRILVQHENGYDLQLDYDINDLSFGYSSINPKQILMQNNKKFKFNVAESQLEIIGHDCEWNLNEIVIISNGKYREKYSYALIDAFFESYNYKEAGVTQNNPYSLVIKTIDYDGVRFTVGNSFATFYPSKNNLIMSWENSYVYKLNSVDISKKKINIPAVQTLNNSQLNYLTSLIQDKTS